MHELSIAMSILDIAAEEAKRHKSRVLAVHLRVGALSGVMPQALESAFELARDTADLPDCRLIVEDVPITIYCPLCAAEKRAESIQSLCCIDCGAPAERVVAGRDLEVFALEIEE